MEYPISSSYSGSITHFISSQKTKASSFQQRTHWAWFIRWRNWLSIISLNYTSHVYDSNFQIMTSLHQLFFTNYQWEISGTTSLFGGTGNSLLDGLQPRIPLGG